MSPSNTLILLVFVAWVTCELVQCFRTGRARGSYGLVTVHTQPDSYWRFVYSRCITLAVSGSFLVWTLTGLFVCSIGSGCHAAS